MTEVLRSAENAAREAGRSRIHRVVLRVGAFSSAVPESLEFAFQALRDGTLAGGAELEIERVPGVAFCGVCQREFEVEDVIFMCPACGQISGELRRGRELDLLRIEAS